MKNFKKVVALVLALVLVLSMGTTAFAAEMTAAEQAETLGLLEGTGDGVTAEYLAKTPNRLQAAIISLRLRGLEDEAKAYEGTEMFADSDEVTWAEGKNILAYLKANPTLGWIGTDDMFMPYKDVTAQAYVKVMLEALGYVQGTDFEWSEVFTFAATVGLDALTADTVMTNNELAVGSVEALAATNSEDVVLLDALIAAEAITEEAAVTAGLKEATPEALAVEGATMNNLAEIVITFNKELAADKDVAANFEVKVGDSVKAIDSVAKDGAVVTVTVTEGAIAQQDDVILTVKTDAGLTEAYTTTFTNVLDKEVPEVVDVTVVGPNKFKVTFTEPLKTAPTAEINNGAIYAAVEDFAVGVTEVNVKAGASLTDGTAYTVKVSGGTDYADYTMITYTSATTYTKSAADVTVELVSVKEEEVKIKFSAPVKAADLGVDDFYHTFSAFKPDTVTPKSATATYEDEYTLAFTTYKVGYTSTTLKALKADVVDEWGNKMSADGMLTIVAVKDETAPTVSIVEVKDNKLTVKFSEEVKEFTTANVTMKDSEGDEVTVTGVTVDGDDATKYEIAYASQEGGEYTFEIKDVVDKSLAENKLDPAPTTLTATITDTTEPSLSGTTAVYTGQVVFVSFPEKMDTTVTTKENWRATVEGSQYTPTKAEFFGTSNKEVKLTFADGVTTSTITALIVGKVADASGNEVADLFTDLGVVTVASQATISEVKTIDSNKVTIKVGGKITEGLAANNVVVGKNGVTVAAASIDTSFVDDGVNTLITVTLKAELTFGAAEVPTYAALAGMKTDKGFNVSSQAVTTAVDGIAPSYVSVATSAAAGTSTAALTFDESLVADAAADANVAFDLVVVIDGTTAVAGVDYTTEVTAAVLTVTFVKDVDGKKVTIDTVDAPLYIRDASEGNKANAIGDKLELQY